MIVGYRKTVFGRREVLNMLKNMATIVEVFGDLVLSLIGIGLIHNHRTMVAADRTWFESGRRLLEDCST